MYYSLGRFGQEEKLKPPLPPIKSMEDKVGLAWHVQRNATQSGFTEDVYGEEEKDPKPQKKTINMATKSSPMQYPKQEAFHVDSSYQYPSLAGCSCC